MRFITSILNLLRFNRKNWKAVALCIFAATIFWFFNALNKNYTTNLTFPLAFDYNTENYVAVRPVPHSIRLNVTGMGWDLFRRSVGVKVPPLVIPLERPSEIKKIVGSTLPALFANQLERFEINFVLTDTLHLALEPKATRWITLRLDSPSILFRKGYAMTSEAAIHPDSVFIEGPWGLVRSLAEPVYLKLQQRNIDENFREDVEVKFLNDELIKRDPPTVSVSFTVDELVQVRDSVPLMLVNYPKGAYPYLGVKKLPCVLGIPSKEMPSFHADSLAAIVDLKNFSRGEEKILPQVKGLPPYSQVLSIDSIYVKF
jgi:hypothetical protein